MIIIIIPTVLNLLMIMILMIMVSTIVCVVPSLKLCVRPVGEDTQRTVVQYNGHQSQSAA